MEAVQCGRPGAVHAANLEPFVAERDLAGHEVEFAVPDGAGFHRHREALLLPRQHIGPDAVLFRGFALSSRAAVASISSVTSRVTPNTRTGTPSLNDTCPRVSICLKAPSLARRMRNRAR